jgi:hypothetical protein
MYSYGTDEWLIVKLDFQLVDKRTHPTYSSDGSFRCPFRFIDGKESHRCCT